MHIKISRTFLSSHSVPLRTCSTQNNLFIVEIYTVRSLELTWLAKNKLGLGSLITSLSSFSPGRHLNRKINPYTGLQKRGITKKTNVEKNKVRRFILISKRAEWKKIDTEH